MILEKLSNKVNTHTHTQIPHIDSPGNWKQTRLPDKIWSKGVGEEERVERKRVERKRRAEWKG